MSEFKDITPAEFACSYSASCPSVHISEDGKELEITGGLIRTMTVPHPNGGGTSEATIRISTDLVRSALEGNNGRQAE